MVANDPNGNSIETLEAAEELAREAGLLPPLHDEKELSKKELRAQKDRERTEKAKARSRVVYKIPLGPFVLKKNPLTEERVVVTVVESPEPRSKNEDNGKITQKKVDRSIIRATI